MSSNEEYPALMDYSVAMRTVAFMHGLLHPTFWIVHFHGYYTDICSFLSADARLRDGNVFSVQRVEYVNYADGINLVYIDYSTNGKWHKTNQAAFDKYLHKQGET